MAACTPPMEETGAGGGAVGVGLGAEDGATSATGWGETMVTEGWGGTGRCTWGGTGSGAWGGIGWMGRKGWAAGVVPNRTKREKIMF